MRGNLVETLVGAVVVIVAVGFIYLAYSRTESGTVQGYQVEAAFDRVGGIGVGSDVRISGIKVGSVVGQSLDPETFQARLTFSINPDYKLPSDSSAKITSEGLLGDSYIAIEPGGMPDMLADGGEIEYTQGSIDLMSLIGQVIHGSVNGDS